MLKGKTVVLGVTGSIAAYKIANLASMLVKLHAEVHVIMTENATQFINPITFETLTNHKCLVETFDRNFQFHVAHVSLAQQADLMLIAPASANVIGKLANGIADDMLTTTAMACTAPMLISPAMNTHMYENPIVQDNLQKLKRFGMTIIDPAVGFLACRDVGAGKMPDPEVLLSHIIHTIGYPKDLANKKVLITAGPTREKIDPVRFISNYSTGKMGYELAKAAMLRGGKVTLISGPVHLDPIPFLSTIMVESANEMYEAVMKEQEQQDILILSAAVADYKPTVIADEKIKKKDGDASIELTRTKDILSQLGALKSEHQYLCGFSMETENLIENSAAKREKKNADMIVANSLREEGAGFGVDTNIVTILTKTDQVQLPLMDKEQVAHRILDQILKNSTVEQ
ncbi:MAG: bifunctional phosphopantothenoylcysteine decarboxylase/phosphopantothenate--cysteine ligase CoaBC [Lachnospiraceae bacterium]|nr:bifunctional phosphopantothenoylcysteine decarboxylase/phosphopantothenate--cysteine ligase CoaBC [Lachnospiraceae bacterium]